MSSAMAFGLSDACAPSSSSTISMWSAIGSPSRGGLVVARVARLLVGVPFAGRDEVAQALGDVVAPGARAAIVAFDGGDQADVREAKLGPVAAGFDLEHDVRPVPLLLVLHEADEALRDVPHDLLAGHELGDLLRRAVDVLVAVRERAAEDVGGAVDLARPPSAHVVDGVEHLLGRGVDGDAQREALLRVHGRLSFQKLANARSKSFGLLLHRAPICCAIGSGKMSSSPRSTPSSSAFA